MAIKVIRHEIMADPRAAADVERRFKRELLLARQVTHKNVVRIHDLGEIDGVKYITMPFVEGIARTDAGEERGENRVYEEAPPSQRPHGASGTPCDDYAERRDGNATPRNRS